jgi:hypothetical protein
VKERDQAIGQRDALSLLELEAAKVEVDRKGLSVLASTSFRRCIIRPDFTTDNHPSTHQLPPRTRSNTSPLFTMAGYVYCAAVRASEWHKKARDARLRTSGFPH